MRLSWYGYMVLVGSFFTMVRVHASGPANCCQFPPISEIRALLSSASAHDARLLLNLLYWSYERSSSTLLTQAAAEKNLHEQWNAWQACADRRLNPKAIAAPFHEHEQHEAFEALDRQFHTTQSQYSAIVALATDACRYSHQPVAFFVESIREQARQHVMHIMQQHLAVVAKELEQQLGTQTLAMRSDSDSRGLIAYLINQIAVASFAQLDASWRLSSNHLMMQFLHIQGLFNGLWETIETARATFYKTYFNLVHRVMCEYHFPSESFTNVVRFSEETEPVPFMLSIS